MLRHGGNTKQPEMPVTVLPNNKNERLLLGEIRNSYKILVGKPEGKRPLGRPMRRREDNIKANPEQDMTTVWT
jgi:hypothetical protein